MNLVENGKDPFGTAGTKLPVYNTHTRQDNGNNGLPFNGMPYDTPAYSISFDGEGNLNTHNELIRLFEDEQARYLLKPQIEYMDRLYNSPDNKNTNYTLSQIWLSWYGDEQTLDSVEAGDFNQIIGEEEGELNEENIRFTNNPKRIDPSWKEGTEVKKHVLEEDGITNILITEDTIVRFVFNPSKQDDYVNKNGVNFYDYDITTGKIYTTREDALNDENALPTSKQDELLAQGKNVFARTDLANPDDKTHGAGINSIENYDPNSSGTRLAFGNANTGTGLGELIWKQGELNNTPNRFNEKINPGTKATYQIVTGLGNDGGLAFNDGLNRPAVFGSTELTGKTIYDDQEYRLVFNRVGGTYTLSRIQTRYDNDGDDWTIGEEWKDTNAINLEKMVRDASGLMSNAFWPMDTSPSYGTDGHDLKFGSTALSGRNWFEGEMTSRSQYWIGSKEGNFPVSDDGQNHNAYFGMDFSVDFVLDPGYCGPLRYLFYGDDDLYVFLSKIDPETGQEIDTQLVADMGGVHSAFGEYVDLWDTINRMNGRTTNSLPQNSPREQYRLRIFYAERGASGSTCFMRFTVPFVSIEKKDIDYLGSLMVEKIVAPKEDSDLKADYTFQIKFKNDQTENDMINRYAYSLFERNKNGESVEIEKPESMPEYISSEDKFTLKSDQFIVIYGLPDYTRYIVEELDGRAEKVYTTVMTSQDEQTAGGHIYEENKDKLVNGTLKEDVKENVVKFLNVMNPGILSVKKELAQGEESLENQEFTFRLTLKDSSVKKVYWLKNGAYQDPLTVDEKGSVQFILKAHDKAEFINLPTGLKYSVEEINNTDTEIDSIFNKKGQEPSSAQKIENGIQSTLIQEDPEDGWIFTNRSYQKPDFKLTKYQKTGDQDRTQEPLKVEENQQVTYDLDLTNTSENPIENITVTDRLPVAEDGTELVFDTVLPSNPNSITGSYDKKTKTVTWNVDRLEAKETVTLSFRVKTPEQSMTATWRNTATARKEDRKVNSNTTVITETEKVPDDGTLLVSKKTTGAPESDTTAFPFSISFSLNGQPFNGPVLINGTKTTIENGNYSTSLASGEQIRFEALPRGLNYTISEVSGNEFALEQITLNGEAITATETVSGQIANVADSSYGYVFVNRYLRADLTARKLQSVNGDTASIDSRLVNAGDQVTYFIQATNTGEKTLTNVQISDVIPAGLNLVSIQNGGVQGENGTIYWTVSALAPQEQATVSFTVSVPEPEEGKEEESRSWTNIASYGSDQTTTKDTNEVLIGEHTPVLTILKMQRNVNAGTPFTIDPLVVEGENEIEYQIVITNTTQYTAYNLLLSDLIPVGENPEAEQLVVLTDQGNAQLSNAGNRQQLNWSLGNLEGGQSVSVTFKIKVPTLNPGESQKWINQAVLSYEKEESGSVQPLAAGQILVSNEVVATEKVEAIPLVPQVTIGKMQRLDEGVDTKDPIDGKRTSIMTYSIQVASTGNTAATDVVVTDPVPEELVIKADTVSHGGTVQNGTVVWHLGDMEPGTQVNLTFEAEIPASSTREVWDNTAQLTYTNSSDSESGSLTSNTVVVNVKPKTPHLSIEKEQSLDGETFTKDKLTGKSDQTVTYRIKVTNDGDDTAKDVTLDDVIPEGLLAVADSANEHGLITEEKTSWNLGDLEPGKTITVEFKAVIPQNPKQTEWINQAEALYSNRKDPNTPVKSNQVVIDLTESHPAIQIEKHQKAEDGDWTKDLLTLKDGDKLTYRLTVTSTGDATAKNVVVTDNVPKGLILDESSITDQGTVSKDVVTWMLGDLEAGEKRSVEFTVSLPTDNKKGQWTNVAKAQMDKEKPVSSNEVVVEKREDEVRPPVPGDTNPDYRLEKMQVLDGGTPTKEALLIKGQEEITYTLIVTNTGKADGHNLIITDVLPEGLVLKDAPDAKVEGNTLIWNIEKLEAGQSVKLTFTASVPAKPGTYRNTFTLTSQETTDTFTSNEVVVSPKSEQTQTPPSHRPGTSTGANSSLVFYGSTGLAAMAALVLIEVLKNKKK